MEKLFMIFYVLEGRQKKRPNHFELINSAVYKSITTLLVIFTYLFLFVSFLLFKLFDFKFSFLNRGNKIFLVFIVSIFAFSLISYFKRYFKKKYPELIPLHDFSSGKIKEYKTILMVLIAIVFIPLIYLLYQIIFKF